MPKRLIMKILYTKTFLFFLILLTISGLQAQNLVPNPNFELYNPCPNNVGQLDVLDNWYNPTAETPDYFNACYSGGPSTNVGVPGNIFGAINALSGNGYAGFYAHTGYNGPKEYIQNVLTEPLVAGECYEVEMFIAAAYSPLSNFGINHVGIYISATPPSVGLDGNFFFNTTTILS